MNHTLITGLFVYPGKVGGAEAYFNNLLSGFVELGIQDRFRLLLNQALRDQYHPIIHQYEIDFIELKQNRVLYDSTLPFMYTIPPTYQLIFSPNYVSTWKGLAGKRTCVTTIHDLQYQHFPQFFSAKKRKWLYWAHINTLKACKKVVCISEFVKNDICRVYGEKYRDKLIVIPNPIDFPQVQKSNNKKSYGHPSSYILSVAAHYPHKNTLTLVRAFQLFNQRFPEVKLVLTGQLSNKLVGGNYESYGAQLHDLFAQNPNIVTTGYVPSEELAHLYTHCSLFVFPSLFEGFGMPPVEAMGVGKPVITSRCGSLEEVTLGQATYLDHPEDEEELAEKMIACFKNLEIEQRKAAGKVTSLQKAYSLKTVAQAYANLFESL